MLDSLLARGIGVRNARSSFSLSLRLDTFPKTDDKHRTFVFFLIRNGLTLHRMGSVNATVVLLVLGAEGASNVSVHASYGSIHSESPKTHVRNLVVVNQFEARPYCDGLSAAALPDGIQQQHSRFTITRENRRLPHDPHRSRSI